MGESGLETALRLWQRALRRTAIIVVLIVFRITPVDAPLKGTMLETLKGTMPEKRLEELKAEREPLYQRLSSNPNETHLAIEIKLLDDQIAECNHLIKQKVKART